MTRARIIIDLLIIAAYGFAIGGAVSQGGAYWYAIVPVALLMIAYNLYCVAVDVGLASQFIGKRITLVSKPAMNKTVAGILAAAASLGALPEMPRRFDRTRPEPAHVQAAIQHAAELKRARKAAKRRRDVELTGLGREVSRTLATQRSLQHSKRWWTAARATNAALDMLDARRRRP